MGRTRSNMLLTPLSFSLCFGVEQETKAISNPFRCVHAAALITFGETVGGQAVFTLLGKKDRAILTNINAEVIISKETRTWMDAESKKSVLARPSLVAHDTNDFLTGRASFG